MDEFTGIQHLRHAGKTLFQPVFNRFNVVIGSGFDGFYRLGIVQRKFGQYAVDFSQGEVAKRRHFGDFRLGGQRFEPAQLHLHPRTHQAVFGKNRTQGFGGFGVTAIKGRQGKQRINHGALGKVLVDRAKAA